MKKSNEKSKVIIILLVLVLAISIFTNIYYNNQLSNREFDVAVYVNIIGEQHNMMNLCINAHNTLIDYLNEATDYEDPLQTWDNPIKKEHLILERDLKYLNE